MQSRTLRAANLLLCMLCFAGSQWRVNASGILYQLENVLWQNCEHVASFLPLMCKAAPLGPACCGLMSVVSFCSPSCTRQSYGVQTLLNDEHVCESLRLTEEVFCQGLDAYDERCQKLRQLTGLMCNPYVAYISNSRRTFPQRYNNTAGVTDANILYREQATTFSQGPRETSTKDTKKGSSTADKQICFGLPVVTMGEMTGMFKGGSCEKRDVQNDLKDPECDDKKTRSYRSIDGSCNNLQNPRWGKSFEPQKRLVPVPENVDDNAPRTLASSGRPLPPPRVISRVVAPSMAAFANVTNMVMAWGQFIDHDFTGTPMIKNGTKAFNCCSNIAEELKVENDGPCFPIVIPPGDPLGRSCMNFVRSLPFTFPNGTVLKPREQVNSLTSFLDGSAVYSNTDKELSALRGYNGKLKVTADNMLPENKEGTCKKEKKGDYCMLAGDKRVNVFVGLGALHTTFVREHNRIVDVLKRLNPHWDEERLFQEARKIVSAEFQHLTFVHWLPLILNDVTLAKFRLKPGHFKYDRTIDPTVDNVFSTVTFRFGHSQVTQEVKVGRKIRPLQDTLMRPQFVLRNLTAVIRGLVSEPTDKVDRFFADGLTNHMFETSPTAMDGLDLVSVNIQRGRDHRLPAFNAYREFCQLPRIEHFDDPGLTVNLGKFYEDVDDIDTFVGIVVEKRAPGALVGPTLLCLLGTQFRAMKWGDRFFYETNRRPEGFTREQLQEIRKITLAKILCDNNPKLGQIQRDVFLLENKRSNPMEQCDTIPSIDLSKWSERRSRLRYTDFRSRYLING